MSNLITRLEIPEIRNFQRVEVDGKIFRIPPPAEVSRSKFVGCETVVQKIRAAWTPLDDLPLHVRIYGPPGVGKTELANHLARDRDQDLYLISGQEDMTASDIAVTPTITSDNTIEYVISPLFAAMINGGICFFDEIAKAPASALTTLASVLDSRQELTSIFSGVRVKAHPDFRFVCALNENEEIGTGLPAYIRERTLPAIHIGYPSIAELEPILHAHFAALGGQQFIKAFCAEFAHVELSLRTAISLIRYSIQTMRLKFGDGKLPTNKQIREILRQLSGDMNIDLNDEDTGLDKTPARSPRKRKKSGSGRVTSSMVNGNVH